MSFFRSVRWIRCGQPRTKNRDALQNWVFNFPVSKVAPRPAEMVNLLVEEYMETPSVDKNRIYIMGISMGGIGTLEFLHRWPEKYAAAACNLWGT